MPLPSARTKYFLIKWLENDFLVMEKKFPYLKKVIDYLFPKQIGKYEFFSLRCKTLKVTFFFLSFS